MWDSHKTGCQQRWIPSTKCAHLPGKYWKCSHLALPRSVGNCCFIRINTLVFSIFLFLGHWLLALVIAWDFPYTTNIFNHLTPIWRCVNGGFCLLHNWEGSVFNSFAVNILCRYPRGESVHPCPLANHILNGSEQLFLGCPWAAELSVGRATCSSKILKSVPAPHIPPAPPQSLCFHCQLWEDSLWYHRLCILSGSRRCQSQWLLTGLAWNWWVRNGQSLVTMLYFEVFVSNCYLSNTLVVQTWYFVFWFNGWNLF